MEVVLTSVAIHQWSSPLLILLIFSHALSDPIGRTSVSLENPLHDFVVLIIFLSFIRSDLIVCGCHTYGCIS